MPSYTFPGSGAPRPGLPTHCRNPHIKELGANLPTVKFQEIVRDGQSTVVARMKVPTPNGHAFILRRLDTGAVSLTTMFRAAFPLASEAHEKEESAWVKANYDVPGTNGLGITRFAGTWVSEDTALELAPSYLLQDILSPLLEARPDPDTEYRKSSRTQQQTPAQQLPTPSLFTTNVSPVPDTPSVPKRRREAPLQSPALIAAAPTSPAETSAKSPSTVKTLAKPPSTVKATPTRAGVRRSTRMTSPTAAPVPRILVAPKTPRSPRKQQVATPAGSDETAVDEEDEVVQIDGPDMSRDIAEQKELIEAFKAQREAARAAEDVDTAMENTQADEGRKREREEEAPPSFKFKEPKEIVADQERQIATNRRVRGIVEMTPERRSFAWGLGAFAAAAAAVSFLPLSNPWF
ncbi:hypothetical protein K488DRAFT_45201 [Vararia minispora EC-137]|uniref:Uncharacterized protein n=1 Tax=Vararia minispora EC-137 TaxID=1314806 RepID=A0ACB8QSM7_9AGAM|nr:hypothetical protein K488DRAFT_45201 [Vararia minispora EC-137]